MNIRQIKEKYTCLDYLGESLIVKKLSNGWLCRCPWRTDAHPSLSVTLDGKGWQDHADGTHGNLIDLVAKTIGSNDFSLICAEFEKSLSSFEPVNKFFDESKEKRQSFLHFEVVPLKSKGLFAYLHNRGIDTSIAKNLCSEAHYSFSQEGKPLYALAFANNKGGYELRSSFFKGSKSPKGITFIKDIDNAPFVVFEGFIDALSFFTLCGGVRHNFLVLNSVVNVDAAIRQLSLFPGHVVYLILDNDSAGDDTTRKMLEHLPNAIDIRARIAPYKDINDYLMAQCTKLPL